MSLLIGAIVIWSGSSLDIPDGFQLCDGTNGTPDLRNRFIVGAGDIYSVGDTGGNKDTVLVAHTHTGSTSTIGNHNHSSGGGGSAGSGSLFGQSIGGTVVHNISTSTIGNHSHTFNILPTGTSGIDTNLPPYFALCYIQQIS